MNGVVSGVRDAWWVWGENGEYRAGNPPRRVKPPHRPMVPVLGQRSPLPLPVVSSAEKNPTTAEGRVGIAPGGPWGTDPVDNNLALPAVHDTFQSARPRELSRENWAGRR